jgi:hypothetical protein
VGHKNLAVAGCRPDAIKQLAGTLEPCCQARSWLAPGPGSTTRTNDIVVLLAAASQMVDPSEGKMTHQLDEDGEIMPRKGPTSGPVPPEGHVSTADAADMLGVTSSYVRTLIRNWSAGTTPCLTAKQVVTKGGRGLLYVQRQDVIELRNSGAVRSRRNRAEESLEPGTTSRTDPQAGVTTTESNSDTGQALTRPEAGVLEPNWGLELELASANARLAELQKRVNVLEVLNKQLDARYQETRARLRDLARAQMQLLEGYAGDPDNQGVDGSL